MQRTVIYECVGLRAEYSGGMKIQATNHLAQYVKDGWQVIGVSGGGAIQPATGTEPIKYAMFAVLLEKQ